MTRFIRFSVMCMIALCLTTAAAFAQNVRGKVLDRKTGEAVPGIRIQLLDKDGKAVFGTVSRAGGLYQIAQTVPNGTYKLVAAAVGYKRFEKNVTVSAEMSATDINVIEDVRGLEEVVVTGVASRTSKATAEVAVARIDASNLTEKVGYNNAGQLISGKVAGVTITPASGQVGGGIRFNVRAGAGLFGGDPTVFIDGVRVASGNVTGFGSGGQQTSALADLNPADIENIEILKGAAAAALYGPQGQNGVVLIKTKRGRSRGVDEVTVNYQGLIGYNQNQRDFTPDMHESWEQANAIFRKGAVQQHNVSVQGSSGVFNYFAGFETRDEDGFVIQNQLNRRAIRLNIEAVTSKKFNISVSANYIDNFTSRPQNDNNIFGWQGNTRLFSPYNTPAGAAGAAGLSTLNRSPRSTYGFTDSLAIAAYESSLRSQRIIVGGEMNYTPEWSFAPGLRFRGAAGLDARNIRNTTYVPANFNLSGLQGERGIFNVSDQRVNFEGTIAYDFKLMDGKLSATSYAGFQGWNDVSRTSTLTANRFPTEIIQPIGSGDATTRVVGEGFSNNRNAGWFVRHEMNYDQTYFLSGAFRNDFASSVGISAPNIFYPQVSTAIRLDKLEILPESINLLKLRAAYGETGSLPGLTDGKELIWSASASPYGAGATRNLAGNPLIAPERIKELEVGFEIEFDNAYGGEFTYIIGSARNSLINLPRAPSTGLGARPSNIGGIDQWGFESLIYAKPIQTADYSLELNAVFNFFDNKVVDLGFSQGGPAFFTDGFNRQFIVPGQRRGQYIGFRPVAPRFRADGYYDYTTGPRTDQPGVAAFLPTADTTGLIRGENNQALGYAVGAARPLYTGSFSVNFRFLRDFTIYALAEYGLGGNNFNGTLQFATVGAYWNNPRFNVLATQLGIFGSGVSATNGAAATERGPAAQIAVGRVPGVNVLTPNTPEYQAAAEEFMKLDARFAALNVQNYTQQADWLRIREVSLRWNGTQTFNDLTGLSLKNLGLTLTANNLALFTNYKGPEVELNANPGSTVRDNTQDFLTMMQAKTFNFMVSLGF